jgi:hypothetical protein
MRHPVKQAAAMRAIRMKRLKLTGKVYHSESSIEKKRDKNLEDSADDVWKCCGCLVSGPLHKKERDGSCL